MDKTPSIVPPPHLFLMKHIQTKNVSLTTGRRAERNSQPVGDADHRHSTQPATRVIQVDDACPKRAKP